MSGWDSYVEKLMKSENDAGGIIGHDSTIWAASESFKTLIKDTDFSKEYLEVLKGMKNQQSLYQGFKLLGIEWIPVLIESDRLYGRKDKDGIIISNSKTTTVIAKYNTDKLQPGESAVSVYALVEPLKQSNF